MQVTKNLKDIHGPALAIVHERLKPYGAFQGLFLGNLLKIISFVSLVVLFHGDKIVLLSETFESAKTISTGPASKSGTKVAKPSSNGYGDRIPKHGSKAVSSVCLNPLLFIFSFLLRNNKDIDFFHGL